MKLKEPKDRNHSEEYKKRVKLPPLLRTILKYETRRFMLDEATSNTVENQGDVVIKQLAFNIGKKYKDFASSVIEDNPEYKKVFPKSLPRWGDNALLDVELAALTLGSYRLEHGELISIPFTLLISDKTYSAALKSPKNEITYLSDRLSKQLKKHTGRTVDFVIHLEVEEILTKQDGTRKLVRHKLPHLHGNIVCTRKEFGDGNGYDKTATVRNALKAINHCKKSKAFNNDTDKFGQHELRGEFELRKHRSIDKLALGWSHYISKNAIELSGKSRKDVQRGSPKTLPDVSAKLFTSTRGIRRPAEEIYNEIRNGYNSEAEAVEPVEELNAAVYESTPSALPEPEQPAANYTSLNDNEFDAKEVEDFEAFGAYLDEMTTQRKRLDDELDDLLNSL